MESSKVSSISATPEKLVAVISVRFGIVENSFSKIFVILSLI